MIKEIFIQDKRPHESGAKHVSGYAITQTIFLNQRELYMGLLDGQKNLMRLLKKLILKTS